MMLLYLRVCIYVCRCTVYDNLIMAKRYVCAFTEIGIFIGFSARTKVLLYVTLVACHRPRTDDDAIRYRYILVAIQSKQINVTNKHKFNAKCFVT